MVQQGGSLVSAVARKDTSRVAAEILLNQEWEKSNRSDRARGSFHGEEIVASQRGGKTITYVDESVEEAYKSRKMASTKLDAITGQYLYND